MNSRQPRSVTSGPLTLSGRREHGLDQGFRLGSCDVMPGEGRIVSPGGSVRIEPRAMTVLIRLAAAGGRIVTREALVDQVWGHSFVTDDALTRCISQLRKALGDDRRQPKYLETVPKRGYRLLGAICPPRTEDSAAVDGTATLLVLPFQNLSGRDDDEYLADGITELLITRLAGFRGLSVISRTTAMHYRGMARSLPQIAADVGASHVLEGSVLHSTRQLQVVVQLIEARTDRHVWAASYTRRFGELLALENEISQAIAVELHARLQPEKRRAAPEIAASVLRDYLMARFLFAHRTEQGLRRAIAHFEAVLREQPEYAPALAGIAESSGLLALYGAEPPAVAFEQSRGYAERALTADPDCAEAHVALAEIEMFYDWDFASAEQHAAQALELNAGYPMSHLILGNLRLIRGDFVAAQNELAEALRVDPLNIGLNMNLGDYLILERRYREAVAALERTLDLSAESAPARYRLVLALALAGDHDRSRRELNALAGDGDPLRRAEHAAIIAGLAGRRLEARAALAELLSDRGERLVNPWAAARACAAAGELEWAFAWLDRAIDQRSSSVIFLGVAPLFDPLRDDPRFATCLRRIGLG